MTLSVDVLCMDPNPHELLVHRIATMTNVYGEAGLEVTARGPEETASAPAISLALGGSLMRRLREESDWFIVSVNVDKPLFWIYARPGKRDLRGCRLAGWPTASPPAMFLEIYLRSVGLDSAQDLEMSPVTPGPGADEARLEQVLSGDADAGLFGSQLPPNILRQAGLKEFLFIGDVVRVPTTGIAVDRTRLDVESGVVDVLVEAHHIALRRLHADSETAITALEEIFERGTRADAEEFYRSVVTKCFTESGQTSPGIYRSAVETMADTMGILDPPPWQDVYGTGGAANV
jgi:hypothetical protein